VQVVDDQQPEPGHLPQLDRRHMRASDADRDRVAEVLREALAEGRLTPVEHAERLEAVFASRTLGELEPITRDLPVPDRPGTAVPAAGPRPAPAGPPAVALFSEVKRHGRWTVAERTEAWAVFGAVRLDLTDAVLAGPDLTINAVSLFGSVNIDVPEDMEVHDSGFAVFGSRSSPAEGAAVPGARVLRVTGWTLFGDCNVRRRRRKRP
jgi:hypothetical protein